MGTTTPPGTVDRSADGVDAFLDHLAVERGLSGATVEAYARDLCRLASCLERAGRTVLTADRDALVAFAREEAHAGRAPTSRARALSAVRTLYRFLHGESWLSLDPSDVLVSPRLPAQLPRSIGRSPLERLLAGEPGDSPRAIRDRAMLELLYASGMRASEIVGLLVDDLNLERLHFRCRGKGNKERMAPLGREAARRVGEYLQRSRPLLDRRGASGGRLFLNTRGKPLSRQSLWRIVKRHGVRAGIPERVYPHIFRHTFATHLVEAGADLRVVQELLGHADVTTTQIYAHVDRSRLKGVHQRFHPRG